MNLQQALAVRAIYSDQVHRSSSIGRLLERANAVIFKAAEEQHTLALIDKE